MKLVWQVLVILLSIIPFNQLKAESKLFQPSHHKPKAPLLVVLHGCMVSALEMEEYTRFSQLAEERGFYVLYPEIENPSDQTQCWNFYNESSQQQGFGHGSEIIRTIEQTLYDHPQIDSRKIYLAGMSAGASEVNLLASCYPDYFAGIAVHSGMGYGFPKNWQESLYIAQVGPFPPHPRNKNCDPSAFRGQVLVFHGSRDPVMNPLHFYQTLHDYFWSTTSQKKWVWPRIGKLGYLEETYFSGEKLVGKSFFIYGLTHDWSGCYLLNSHEPRGPDASQIIVDTFMGAGIAK